jgi:hypothetical protein
VYRSYPHGLDAETIDDQLNADREMIAEMSEELAHEPDNAMMSGEIGQAYRSVACYRYAKGESASAVRGDLATGLNLMTRGFGLGLVTDPYDFVQMLALSEVLADSGALSALGRAERDSYTNEDVEAGEVVYAVAEAMRAASRADWSAMTAPLAPYLGASPPKRMLRYDKLVYFPLIELFAALEARDGLQFQAALQRREKDFAQFFARADDQNDPEALIDMPGLALVRLALVGGLAVSDASVYRPRELLPT